MRFDVILSVCCILIFATATGLIGWSASILFEKGNEQDSKVTEGEVYQVMRIYYNTTICMSECSWSFPGGVVSTWCCQSVEGEDYYRIAMFSYNNGDDACIWKEEIYGYHEENFYTYAIGSKHLILLEEKGECRPVDSKHNDYYVGGIFVCFVAAITAALTYVSIIRFRDTIRNKPINTREFYELPKL